MYMTEELTKHARQLLELVQQHEGWISRTGLADLLHKKRLIPYDVEWLGKLEAAGLIESRVISVPGGIGKAFEYKAR